MNVIGRKVTKIFDIKDDDAMKFYDEAMNYDETMILTSFIVSSLHRFIASSCHRYMISRACRGGHQPGAVVNDSVGGFETCVTDFLV